MKMPKDAKRVFAGAMFDVYRWNKQLDDGSIRPVEMVKRIHEAVLIIPVTNSCKILMRKHIDENDRKIWSFVEGYLRKGEDKLQAAERTSKDKFGSNCKELEFWFTKVYDHKIDFRIHYYIARGIKFVEKKPEKGKTDREFEVTFEDMMNHFLLKTKYVDLALKFYTAERRGELKCLKRYFLGEGSIDECGSF